MNLHCLLSELIYLLIKQSRTDNCGLQINKHSSGHMFASSCLGEEGIEGIIASPDGLVTWHLTVRLDTML